MIIEKWFGSRVFTAIYSIGLHVLVIAFFVSILAVILAIVHKHPSLLQALSFVMILSISVSLIRIFTAKRSSMTTVCSFSARSPARDNPYERKVQEVISHIDQKHLKNVSMLVLPIEYKAISPFIIMSASPNYDHVIVLDTEQVTIYNDEELRGIIAHEIGHAKHKDWLWMILINILISAMTYSLVTLSAFSVAGALMYASSSGIFEEYAAMALAGIILSAGVFAFLWHYGNAIAKNLSFAREYAADAFATSVVGKDAMLQAFISLERYTQPSTILQNFLRMMGYTMPGANTTHPSYIDRKKHIQQYTP